MSDYKYVDEKREHLHTLRGKPLLGTSTVCNVIEKPLVWWAAELAAVEALSTDAFYPELRDEFKAVKKISGDKERKAAMDALCKKYPAFKAARWAHYEAKNDAADKGTDMHAELEKYVKLMITDQMGKPHEMNDAAEKDLNWERVQSFAAWSVKNVDRFLWSEAHCYSERLWVGGISDCGALLKNGKVAVFDFKSSKDAYYGQFVQAAGYAAQIEENGLFDAEGNELKVSLQVPIEELCIVPFGSSDPTPREQFDVEGFKLDFASATRLYKAQQLFNQ